MIEKSYLFILESELKNKLLGPRTTDTQWRHKSKMSVKLGRCGRQNMLRPYLKIWEWEWIFGRAVKAISSMGVRSPWVKVRRFWPLALMPQWDWCHFEVALEFIYILRSLAPADFTGAVSKNFRYIRLIRILCAKMSTSEGISMNLLCLPSLHKVMLSWQLFFFEFVDWSKFQMLLQYLQIHLHKTFNEGNYSLKYGMSKLDWFSIQRIC